MVILKRSFAEKDVDAKPAKALRAVCGCQVSTKAPHTLHHGTEITSARNRWTMEVVLRSSRLCPVTRWRDQTLAGDTAHIQAVAAHEMSLDECDTRSEARGTRGGDQPRRTGPDDHQVITILGDRIRPVDWVYGLLESCVMTIAREYPPGRRRQPVAPSVADRNAVRAVRVTIVVTTIVASNPSASTT